MTPEELLEEDMRRYLYDREPDRRIVALERYRERKGLAPWGQKRDDMLDQNGGD